MTKAFRGVKESFDCAGVMIVSDWKIKWRRGSV